MLAQQTQTESQTIHIQFLVCDVQRVGDWLTRECPACHRIGYVSIYPNREAEALNYITRADWMCKPCVDIQREITQNFYAIGGDALVF